MTRSILTLLASALLLLSGCPATPASSDVCEIVDLDGGELCTADRKMCITVPPDALERPAALNLTQTEVPRPNCSHGSTWQLSWSPSCSNGRSSGGLMTDIEFDLPVRVTLPIDPDTATGVLQLGMLVGSELRFLDNVEVDLGSQQIQGDTLQMGTFLAIDGPDLDDDGWGFPADCDDANPAINPGASEVFNGFDDDCDGQTDEPSEIDDDGDGSVLALDCDDTDATVYPGATETCDGRDEDCDDEIDEDFDVDGDGFFSGAEAACVATWPFVDCDDTDADVNPLAEEIPGDGIDNNCDGIDEEIEDIDGDGYTVAQGDCDDADANISPDASEQCDEVDNDCDGTVDAEFDVDGDGWFDIDSCPEWMGPLDCDDFDSLMNQSDFDHDGWSTCAGDCDDNNAMVNPGATEIPGNGIDDNCDGDGD